MSLKVQSQGQGQEIAIIGSGCRFPGGATTPSKLWDLLRNPNPNTVASEVPALKGYYHKNGQYHGHVNVKEAYLLAEDEAVRRFDAAFFGISPAEANVLDPQIRLLLETVYEALEASGQTIDGLRGSDTAVYAGQMVNDYELLMYRDHENLGKYHATGTSRTMLSNRISYFYDWHGPSMTIDTACSSSLVALHHAVQQLRSGHSRVAVVAGSNLIYDVGTFIAESNLQMLSPEGRSRMWDADANGYARGEGVAAVILKSRQAAEEDGDHIECIIRETAVNQDGKTPGQTMPSASAQAQLIRDCYARAGLDLTNPAHRPQYFEAHGTGTPAGDPIEAEAISTAFFPDGERPPSSPGPLLVGSIKTIIGHTEGTAGIAGLLKASLALKKSMVPPNLLFNRLNPSIEPFYTNLLIPTSLTPWPAVPKGSPRRASVNSFGFGGTNAHVILESYTPSTKLLQPRLSHTIPNVFMPFTFSAASETSLRSYLSEFVKFLRESKTAPDLRDIAYTLDSRRTRLPVATAVGASTAKELCTKLEAKIEAARVDPEKRVGVRSLHQSEEGRKSRILGVFTGQGAQWAQMGLDLITTSKASRSIVEKLQRRLDQLPDSDRPTWSLIEELGRDASCSRISEAALSQPLCTAIQILQVDLVRAAGIEFTAVVGHSSGEIAAAYAAGFISAEDAICIAYYRGLHSELSQGPSGEIGAMIAVGTSADDAQDLLDYPEFEGRACLAAVNSSTSVTLSGDRDAIDELMVVFQDEKKFVRLLKVDKAYHSHHMKACSRKYLESIAALDIQIGSGGQALWFSSVYGSKAGSHDLLKGPYWDNNMVNPVLFMQAIDSACASVGAFDLVIELGPHPALKGPALQSIQDRITKKIPYIGLFNRGVSAITSFSDGLGYAWTHLKTGAVDLQSYNHFVVGSCSSKLVKGLPTYSWDHDNEYWHESRYARAMRMRPDPVHELLGHLTPDSTEQDMRWRHILRLSEVPWLEGHRLQNVVVFPATGYLVSVLEAALMVCKDTPVMLIEVLDVEIDSALVFDPHDLSVEIILSLTNISRRDKKTIEAEFKYHASSGKDADALELKASGRLRIRLGNPDNSSLPARPPRRPNLVPVRRERFYESLAALDYQYAGQFAALDDIERKLGFATGSISKIEQSSHLIHPAVLDAALQSMFLTYAAPNDGTQRVMHIPRRIRRLTVNSNLCVREKDKQTALIFDSAHTLEFPHRKMICDVDIYPDDIDHAMIQIQELECVPFSQQTARDDKEVFSNVVWDAAHPDAQIIGERFWASESLELASLLDRVAGFYLRVLQQEVPIDHPARIEGPYKNFFKFASHTVSLSHAGELLFEQDTPELLGAPFADSIDIKLLSELGENLVAIVKGEKSATDIAKRLNLIGDWFTNGFGVATFTAYLARVVKQLVHRNPHMHILEIDTETDAATKAVLQEIGPKFSSYTVTGRSADPIDPVQDWLEIHQHKMISKPLDLSVDPRKQGFSEASYDLVVASLALHTKADLEEALRNARLLLKPGGYLVMLELLPTIGPFFGIIFGAFSNWWLGAEKRGTVSPAISPTEWDTLLRTTGFSGVDTSTPKGDGAGSLFVSVSQAVDDKIAFLRDPLSLSFPTSTHEAPIQDLVILGGSTFQTTKVVNQLAAILTPYCANIRVSRSLPDFLDVEVLQKTVVLSLVDLDVSVFARLNNSKWNALKKMLLHVETLIWVSQGRLADNPYANMVLGLMRASARDNPALDYLLLDIEDPRRIDHGIIAETLLRHVAISQWRQRDNIHFAIENELVIDRAGHLLVPRLMMNKEMNDRYNSNHREMHGLAQPNLQNIGVSMSEAGWDIEVGPPFQGQGDEGIQLSTTHSLISPVRAAEFGCMFLVLGKDSASDGRLVALSSTNNSLVRTQKELSVAVKVPPRSEARFLWLIAHYLLASVALRGLSEEDKVLVYEPSSEFASILTDVAASLGMQITFATTKIDASRKLDPNLIVIHSSISKQAISRLANDGFSAFIDMSSHAEAIPIGDRIASAMPAYCQKDTLDSLFSKKAWSPTTSQLKRIQSRLERAVARASAALADPNGLGWGQTPTIGIDELARDRDRQGLFSVLDWTTSSGVPINVQPIDLQVRFPGNKTYWLVGLTGGLGLSLCEWMVQRGARYFAITSRKPSVEKAWLDEMRAKGAHVKVSPCDVTQRDQVIALHAEICSSMPAIAGVAQGVMVLQDTAVQDMSLEQLLTVTKPKVEGSIYLNNLFQENTLDFFVFFSSASSVVGNHGQANYGAANTFMASLAEKRRRQGLAASIIDIGAIFGVGYITRMAEGSVMGDTTLQAGGYVRTSEREFHQLFGEAVLAGRPGSTGPIEIVSGVRRVSQREEQQPVWESWPRMGHFVIGQEGAEDLATSSTRTNIPVKAQLENARNREQIHDIVWDAFTRKLASNFHLDTSTMSKAELAAMRFDQMGIDSLTAVDIREWFMTTLEVKIPVLKILNGVSVGELVDTAVETMPSRLIPNFDGEETRSQASATSKGVADVSSRGPESLSDSSEETSSVTTYDSVRDDPTRANPTSTVILKSVPVSFTQGRFYPSGLFLEDKIGLNHTAWTHVTGRIDPDRLRLAVRSVGEQHEILRTAFFDQDGKQMQHILTNSVLQLEYQQVENEKEVTKLAMELQKGYIYDVARGETVRLILLTSPAKEDFLIIGVHPLVMDATSLQTFLNWLGFHYSNPHTKRQVKQFAEASEQRHADFAAGKLEAELQYWRKEFTTLPPPLPLLTLAKVDERPVLKAYENIRGSCRIGVDTKKHIAALCRRLRATPFHFYLAVLRALLQRYTVNGEDVTMAVAESGRNHDAEDMEVIGCLYNLVLVRLLSRATTRFEDLLEAARDKTYAALANSRFPYPVLVKELDLQRATNCSPPVQVLVDYRTGQRETVQFGESNQLVMMGFDLNVPYDVYLDTIDESGGECAHHIFMRRDMFGKAEAREFAESYRRLIVAFAEEPELLLSEVDLSRSRGREYGSSRDDD